MSLSAISEMTTRNFTPTLGSLDSFGVPRSGDPNSTGSWEDVTSAEYEEAPSGIAINYEVRFAVYTVLSAACLLFNTVSLMAMSQIRGQRTVHHRLLANLAVCDVVGTALLWMYYNSPYIFPRFKLTGLQRCLFIGFVLLGPLVLSLFASSLALLMLASNQYLAISNPLFAQSRVTGGRACMFIGVAWLIAATAASTPAIVMLLLQSTEEGCSTFTANLAEKSLEVCAYVLAGLILVIVLLYARIYREVLKCRQRTRELRYPGLRSPTSLRGRGSQNSAEITQLSAVTGASSSGSAETNYKAFVTTLLLTGTLVVFWLPYMVFNLLSAHINLDSAPDPVIYIKCYVVDFLPMLNFITDPIIYGIRMRDIRRAYWRLAFAVFPRRWFPEQRSQYDQQRFAMNFRSGASTSSTRFNVIVMVTAAPEPDVSQTSKITLLHQARVSNTGGLKMNQE